VIPAFRALAWMAMSAVVLALSIAERAEAHATSTSYLVADGTDAGNVRVTWGVAVADLNWALRLDSDGDGRITWGEIDARGEEVATFVAQHVEMTRGSVACDIRFDDVAIAVYADEPHLSLGLRASCVKAGLLTLKASLFFDTNPTQRTLIDVVTPTGQFTSVLSPRSPEWVEPAVPSALATFTTFVGQGLWHVWIGYDHIAFLILLLLPAVLRGAGTGWRGVSSFRDIASDLFRVVTAFTLAHSITLTLAASGAVQVPVRPVEIAIAASIVVAGVLNLFPAAARARLALAFGFGLVHGFGFANALAELGSGGTRLVPTLAGFNLGVELAQLSLVVLVLPLLFRARNSTFYALRFMPLTSLVAALAGAAWLVARAG
jgi:hypothetical protein